ncbi:vitelline membrane outer layer protein 1 homolog [Mantella aurantiaca]
MKSIVFCLVVFLQVSMNCADITVDNGGPDGEWGIIDVCPEGTVATGFSLKVEDEQGWDKDDSALNGITLYCTKINSQAVVKEIKSSEGAFGSQGSNFFCKNGYLVSFSLRVEHTVHDNTAANNIKFLCSDSEILEGDGLKWGNYGKYSDKCLFGICSITTRVQTPLGFWADDTSLNDVIFSCCMK